MAVFSVLQFLREQWLSLPPVGAAVNDVRSKTFMVTGSNVGLGLEASVHLAKMGPKLLLATSRDTAKCKLTREAILERSDAGAVAGLSTNVAAWPLDLASFESVRAFADRFAAEGSGTLDALVANAGLFCSNYAQTQDGWEFMLQVNYLSTALLSLLLLPHLVNASVSSDAVPRLVIVSSLAHYLGSVTLNDSDTWSNILDRVNDPQFGSGSIRYNLTKLLGVIFVRELAARLPDPTPVVACTINPGYCESRIFRQVESTWYTAWFISLTRTLARSTEEGSKTLVHPTITGDALSMHGRYLSSCQVTEENDFLFTPQGKVFSARVWDETMTVLSRVDERVSEIAEKYLRVDA